MKCIINCPGKHAAWVREFFPGIPPYLLKFANKPYIEFLIEFCILNKINDVRVVTDDPSQEMYEVLGDGSRYGIRISFAATTPDSSLRSIVEKNISFCRGDNLLILSGFLWLDYHQEKIEPVHVASSVLRGSLSSPDEGWLLIGKNLLESAIFELDSPENDDGFVPFRPMDSLLTFYHQCMRIVYEQNRNYNLPGYGDHSNFVIGRNVSIPRTAQVSAPVVLGNSIQFSNDVVVGPGVIIGDNVVIDEKSTVTNTIIMGNSYVGRYSGLDGKIVYKNYVIDPASGLALDIVDEFVLTELVKGGYWPCPVKQRICAFLLLVLATFPFLLLRPFLRVKTTLIDCFMNQQRTRKLALHLYLLPSRSLAGYYFRKLSLDRYHLLPLVVAGHLRLIGNRIMEATPDNASALLQFPDYAPGIFSYSEYMGSEKDPQQSEMDELYYAYNTNFKLNIKIFCGIWFRNFMKRT